MYRTIVYIGLVVGVFGGLGVVVPQSFSSLMIFIPSGIYALINFLLGILLMHFGTAAYFRSSKYKTGFGILGLLLVTVSVFGIVSPTYGGLLQGYVQPSNLLMLLITGVGCLIAALEYNRPSLAEEIGLMYQNYFRHVMPGRMAQTKSTNDNHRLAGHIRQ